MAFARKPSSKNSPKKVQATPEASSAGDAPSAAPRVEPADPDVAAARFVADLQADAPLAAALEDMAGTLERAREEGRLVLDLTHDMIGEGGLTDRHEAVDPDLEDLEASIRELGQLYPVLVEATPDQEVPYRIVAGRRRLKALRRLRDQEGGRPTVKALLIRPEDKIDAWAAQIAENRIRRDLTFLEYARVFGEVENADERARLMSRVGISSAQMSHYTRVIRDIPKEVVELLGAARDVGRDQLFRLGDLCRKLGAEEASRLIREAGSSLAEAPNEKERFGKVVKLIGAEVAKPTKAAAEPTYLSIRSTPARVTVSLDRSVDADFASYMEHRLPVLIEAERAEFEKRRMSRPSKAKG